MIVKAKTVLDASESFVKVVVDINRNILALGCELHMDCAQELLDNGSVYKNLWGANIYPKTKKIDFISLVNIRPEVGNRTMEIQKPEVKKAVEFVVRQLLF
ncbi:MAG: hypothetical protein HY435_01875 [Candidatus Liptonbacteria bacterium]|nr:hypothetical protein [Candidatus Liptonbacteria bacterium]